MKATCLVIVFAMIASIVAVDVMAQSTKEVDAQGVANIIFASSAIGKGQEKSAVLKDKFNSEDKIFARCYFPGPIGNFKKGEEAHIHLWLNGKVVWTGTYSGKGLPEPSWDQIQVYIRNTGDDDFRGAISNALATAPSGENKVQILILRDKYVRNKLVKKGNSVIEEPVFQPINLSKGSFTYTVK